MRDTVTVNSFEEFARMMDRMLDPLRNPQFAPSNWQSVVEYLQELHLQYFDMEAGPDGPWAPLAPYTVAKKGHAVILFEESLLKDSLTQDSAQHSIRQTQPAELLFGTSRPWAWVHQFGSGKIPQRQHTGLTEETVDDVAGAVADELVAMMFSQSM
jgi:phage gpG-like protein